MLGKIALSLDWKALAFGASASLLALAGGTQPAPAAPELPPVSELQPQTELPDPLTMFRGGRVTSKRQWERERRPELKRLFQHYMYGYMPPRPEKITATVERENPQLFGGKATKREVTVRFGPEGTPPIHLLVVVPNNRKGPAPVFLGIAFSGNHAVINDPTVRIPDVWMYPNRTGVVNNRATEAGRGSAVDIWNVERAVDRGYAVATFYNGDVDPDRPDHSEGVQAHYRKAGQTSPDPREWGAVAAWAWGLQRAVDYLVTDRAIDRKRIAVVGHSRNGKAALLAGAFDERIALVIPHQAGTGGTAPSRGKIGESVRQINTSFPHWFNAEFKQFNDRTELLPFDQHSLVALVAPRPVLLSNATEDTWANPEGQFQVLQAAEPVYRLYGAGSLEATTMPPVGQLVSGRLGYFIRPGKHSMNTEDWDAFLDFADRHFGVPQSRKQKQ